MTRLLDLACRVSGPSGGGRMLATALAASAIAFALGANAGVPAAPDPPRTAAGARAFHRPGATLAPSRLVRSAVSWNGGVTKAQTGELVNVFVSSALPPELGTAQRWADFLAGLVHGPELSALTAYVGTFAEMQEICGEHALGCYGANRMVSMGETMFGVTADEVVRHEYGHHIAFHRLNAPWQAIGWGPKHWASVEGVCARAAGGTAFPGDEGANYTLNPGEAWAETYRLLDERRAGAFGSGWQIIDSSFFPDEVAFAAAERDVLQPWTASRVTFRRQRFTGKSKPVWTVPLTTPLDGSIDVTVSLPRGGLHEVALVDPVRKKVLAAGLWAGLNVKKIVTNVCGQRTLVLRITQRGGYGRVAVRALLP